MTNSYSNTSGGVVLFDHLSDAHFAGPALVPQTPRRRLPAASLVLAAAALAGIFFGWGTLRPQ